MDKMVSPEIKELIEVVNYRPAVSLILPFEPKMMLKTDITQALKKAVSKIEQELSNNYPTDTANIVLEKLHHSIAHLDFNTYKKSVAIYVSPVFEKTLYLEIPVEEKIIIDESFEIRDLVYCKKELHKYLLLVLGGNSSGIFLGNTDSFVKIVSSTPRSIMETEKDHFQKVANFSDESARKEILMEKFLHQVDNTLGIILNAYKLPLFVLASARLAGHFKSITKHGSAVMEYIHGNHEDATAGELKEIIKPFVTDWKKLKQQQLLNKLEEAAGKNKLAVGMRDVWRQATLKKGRLLLVEKNFMYPAQHGSNETIIYKNPGSVTHFSAIIDAVDDVIETVLENGGDVEFTDENVLKEYHRIALIQYY